MIRRLAAIALALGMAGAALAAPPVDDGKGVKDRLDLPLDGDVTDANLTVPSNDQMQREYPSAALSMSLAGEATMACSMEVNGLLDACELLNESPAGLGFGAAALRLAAYFSGKPATLDGRPIKRQITIPIRFQTAVPVAPPKPEPIPAPTSPEALVLARQVVVLNDDSIRLGLLTSAWLRGMSVQLVAGGDAAGGVRVMDAYRLGVDDAIAEELDHHAHLMAATMTAGQLRLTIAYLSSPAGAAFRQAQTRIDYPKSSTFWPRVREAAKAHLCEKGGCIGGQPDTGS